ncbi:hypothetical protein M0805_001032 [Coniferiporia weirii]|nr:hypothetical protein M0805_001032 [Coniferiporia weirii]
MYQYDRPKCLQYVIRSSRWYLFFKTLTTRSNFKRRSTRSKVAGAAPAKESKRTRSPDASTPAGVETQEAGVPTAERPAKRARSVSVDPVAEKDASEGAKKTTDPGRNLEPPFAPSEASDAGLKGNFDLYAMNLPFLRDVYLPDDSATPQHEALYNKILEFQAEKDFSAQLFLPDPDAASQKPGRFESGAVCDPVSDESLSIKTVSVVHKGSLVFSESEKDKFATPVSSGPGVTTTFALAAHNCGIASVSGTLKMKQVPVRAKVSAACDDGQPLELFEGHFTVGVSYGSMYMRKGHGSGQSVKAAFGAVRARKDADGNEVGLGKL